MKKKFNDYLLLIGIMLLIFIITFISKGIYPFGNNSIIYSDLKYQITSFFYHFWDSIRGNESLLISFTLGGVCDFLSNLFYYIFSPFSLIVLFVERNDIYKVLSIIIALKCVMSSVTFMFVLKKLFKKLDKYSYILLSILYAISGYFLLFYQITAWMDMMYLLPLIIYGLYKLFEDGKSKIYYIFLSISLIMCFYTSALLLIYIFLISIIYLFIFKKEQIKSRLTSLSINTGLSILTSSFCLIPAYLTISNTYRTGFDLTNIFSSTIGPMYEKIHVIVLNGILCMLCILFVFQFKKYKKQVLFFVISMLLLLLPIVFEPINKLIHLGSYYSLPCRYGFLIMLSLGLGSAYYLNNCDNIKINKNKIWYIVLAFFISLVSFISLYNINDFQKVLENLSFKKNLMIFFIICFIFIGIMFITYIIKTKVERKYQNKILLAVAILFSSINILGYFGVSFIMDSTTTDFNDIDILYNSNIDKEHKIKIDDIDYHYNIGEYTGIMSTNVFSSLNTESNITSIQKLGYCPKLSEINTYGGTTFTDILLDNKYVLSNMDIDKDIYMDTGIKLENHILYQTKKEISHGYILNEDVKFNGDIFENQNEIYKSITGNDNLFNSVQMNKDIEIKDKSALYIYIDMNLPLDSVYNPYNSYEIYVNGELYLRNGNKGYDVPGILYLGTFENTVVRVDVKKNEKNESKDAKIYLYSMDYNLLDKLPYKDIKVEYKDTNIFVKANATEDESGKILYLPISYIDGMNIKNNGEKAETTKIFGEFIGIYLQKGNNNIEISYYPRGFNIGIIISILSIITFIIINKYLLKIININWLKNICYYGYSIAFVLVSLFIFILPMLATFILFIKKVLL